MNKFLIGVLALILAACGGESDGGGGNTQCSSNAAGNDCQKGETYVNLESIPEKFNLRKDSHDLNIDGLTRLNVHLFGFTKDVRLVYEKKLYDHQAVVEIYSVSHKNKNSPIPSAVELKPSSTKMDLRFAIGGYHERGCKIGVENQKIKSLEGACIVRVVVRMPVGSEKEVYVMDELLSKRFIAMSSEDLVQGVDKAIGNDTKFDVINAYVKSHKEVGTTPKLYSSELGLVIKEFPFAKDKFQALKMLHQFVLDRENLGMMIENVFGHFDQEEAKEIVGID